MSAACAGEGGMQIWKIDWEAGVGMEIARAGSTVLRFACYFETSMNTKAMQVPHNMIYMTFTYIYTIPTDPRPNYTISFSVSLVK